MISRPDWRALLRVAMAAAVTTACIAVASSLAPIAYDQKLLSATAPIVSGSPERVVYVSARDNAFNGHIAQYGLPLALPPGAEVVWLALDHERNEQAWLSDGVIGDRPAQVLLPMLASSTVIVEDQRTLGELQRRAGPVHAQVLHLTPRQVIARPHWRFDPGSLARLLLIVTAFFLFVAAFGGSAVRVCVAAVAFLPLHALVVYLTGFITSRSVLVSLVIEMLILLFFVDPMEVRFSRMFVLFAAVMLLIFFVRLDLDGDILTHWLPLARAHYLLGRHDLGFLIQHFHAGHRVAYPPGFPIVIATLFWVAGVPRNGGLQAGDALHNALFLYRIAVAIGAFATLAALTTQLRRRWPASGWWPLTLALFVSAVVPLFVGQAAAAEVWFVPVMFAAILGFAEDDALTRALACALAGAALLIKADAKIAVPLVVLPWALIRRPTRREAIVFLAASIPCGVLAVLQHRAGVVTTFDFAPITAAGLHRVPLVLQTAAKILVHSNYWLALVALLVAGAAAIRRRSALIAPAAGVGLYTAAMTAVYLFSAHDAAYHMETSYERVLAIAVCSIALLSGLAFTNGRASAT